MDDSIDFKGVIAQLQKENEELRVRLTQALKTSPLNDAIDNVVVVMQHSDPMKLYIWACVVFMAIMAVARLIEVFLPHE